MLEHTCSIGTAEGSRGHLPTSKMWFAACSCGWQGPYRAEQDYALLDLREHSAEMNPRDEAAA